jgi:hypothetical protein
MNNIQGNCQIMSDSPINKTDNLSTRFAPQERTTQAQDAIGSTMGDHIWELFVSGDPSEGLAQQLDAGRIEFMVIHDVGLHVSRRFVSELAKSHASEFQRLVIRREGAGNMLAMLYFADVPASNGKVIRVFSSEVQSDDPATRGRIQVALLSRASICAVLLGDVPGPQMSADLLALGRVVSQGKAPYRSMVLQPIGATVLVDAPLFSLSQEVTVPVRRAEPVARALDAWPFLSSAWLLSRPAASLGGRRSASAYDEGIPFDLTLNTASPSGHQGAAPVELGAGQGDPLQRLVDSIVAWRDGALCCVYNAKTMAILARAGALPVDAALLAKQGRMMMLAMQAGSQVLDLGRDVLEGSSRLAGHLVVLHALPGDDHLWLIALQEVSGLPDTQPFESMVRRKVAQQPVRKAPSL